MKKQAILGTLVAGGIFALSAFSGCGTEGGAVFDDDAGSSGASGASGASGSSGTSGIGGSSGASSGTSGNAIDLEECGVDKLGGDLLPVELAMIFDKSSSMCLVGGTYDCDNAASKWPATSAAIRTFFGAASSAGLTVAVRSFGPVDSYTPNSVANNNCAAADYSTMEFGPADLPSAELAEQVLATEPVFIDQGGQPNGWMTMTQTGPAIEGTTIYATQRQTELNGTKGVAMLLVSDGNPTGCGTNPTDFSQADQDRAVAAATAANTAGIKLYVLNIGGDKDKLDAIAAAGGTDAAITIDNPTDANAIGAALAQIRGQTLSCEFPIPATPTGAKPDYTKLNVTYTPPGGTPQLLTQTANCVDNPRGWQYDNPAAPTKITLCAGVCEEVLGSVSGQITVVLGCATQTEGPN